MKFLIGIAGIAVILAIAVLLSSDRRAIRLRVVGAAFALQAAIAVLVLYVPWGRAALGVASAGVGNLLGYANAGTSFLFGRLAEDPLGKNFAIQALPVIIFFAALVSILYHIGLMQLIVRWVGGAIEAVIGVSKVESLCAAANIFVGQSESPLVIRPYLAALTPAAGVHRDDERDGRRGGHDPGRVRIDGHPHRLSARGELHGGAGRHPDGEDHHARRAGRAPKAGSRSAIIRSRRRKSTIAEASHDEERPANLIMAASQGAQTGVRLAVAVGAMVLAFVALVALANGLLAGVGGWFGISRPELRTAARLCVRAGNVPAQRAVAARRARQAGCSGRRSC